MSEDILHKHGIKERETIIESRWQTSITSTAFHLHSVQKHIAELELEGSTFFLLKCHKFVYIRIVMLFDLLLSLLRSRESRITVAVLLSWEPPREGDLPVHNYRVTWMSRNARTAHKHTLHAHTHTVHSNTHTHHTQSRTPEAGKKEGNSRVTQGVRTHFY